MFSEIRNPLLLFCAVVAFVSLGATVTNLVYASTLFAIVVIFLPYLISVNRTVPKVVVAAGLLLLYFLISVLAYAPLSVTEFGFYRRDGNVFVTFLPVLLYGLLRFRVDVEKVQVAFITWATLVNVLVMGFFIAAHGPSFYHYTCSFLFVAHNAAGGYIATLTAISIGMFRSLPRRTRWLLLSINTLALYLTDSRGSILGLIMALVVVFVQKERHAGKLLIVAAVATCILLSFTYPFWLSTGQADNGSSLGGQNLAIDRGWTIVARTAFIWPRAVHLWLASPLFGTGFGSYNDTPYDLSGMRHVLMWNSNKHVVFSDFHAHHTGLHVAAETGLVGLFLLIWMLFTMRHAIRAVEPQSVRYSLTLLFWLAVWSSMTEHRLFTPSQMLPFTLLLGLTIADHRARTESPVEPVQTRTALPLD